MRCALESLLPSNISFDILNSDGRLTTATSKGKGLLEQNNQSMSCTSRCNAQKSLYKASILFCMTLHVLPQPPLEEA